MATSGGQPGNRNAANARRFEEQLRVCLAQNDWAGLREIAEISCAQAKAGDLEFIKFVVERLDGKVKQVIIHEGSDETPLTIELAASAELARKIRGVLRDSAESVAVEPDPTVFGGRDSAQSRVLPASRANPRLPTRQVVGRADPLDGFRGSERDQPLEPEA